MPGRGPSQQNLTLLLLVLVVGTAFLVGVVLQALHAPTPVALGAVILVLCFDAASIAMVWYVNGRS